MGAFTPLAKIWYPDQNDTAKIDTLMATLASSIENGLQPRLALQEKAIGMKAGLNAQVTLTQEPEQLLPMATNSNYGNFINGMSINSSGVVTIQTPGMYLVSAALAVQPSSTSNTSKIKIKKNGSIIAVDEQLASSSYYQVSKVSTALNCVAGDTIAIYGATGVAGGSIMTAADLSMTHFTVVLIRPTPLVS